MQETDAAAHLTQATTRASRTACWMVGDGTGMGRDGEHLGMELAASRSLAMFGVSLGQSGSGSEGQGFPPLRHVGWKMGGCAEVAMAICIWITPLPRVADRRW